MADCTYSRFGVGAIIRWFETEFVKLPKKEYDQVVNAFNRCLDLRQSMAMKQFAIGDKVLVPGPKGSFLLGVVLNINDSGSGILANFILVGMDEGTSMRFPPALLQKA
jgi:hypothetical protein